MTTGRPRFGDDLLEKVKVFSAVKPDDNDKELIKTHVDHYHGNSLRPFYRIGKVNRKNRRSNCAVKFITMSPRANGKCYLVHPEFIVLDC